MASIFLHKCKDAFVKGVIVFAMQMFFVNLFAQKDITTSAGQQNVACPRVTGFKILNDDLPLDSVLNLKTIELSSDENSFSISFFSDDTTKSNNTNYYMRKELTRIG